MRKWKESKQSNKRINATQSRKGKQKKKRKEEEVKYSICDTKLMLTNDLNIFLNFKHFIQSLQIQM